MTRRRSHTPPSTTAFRPTPITRAPRYNALLTPGTPPRRDDGEADGLPGPRRGADRSALVAAEREDQPFHARPQGTGARGARCAKVSSQPDSRGTAMSDGAGSSRNRAMTSESEPQTSIAPQRQAAERPAASALASSATASRPLASPLLTVERPPRQPRASETSARAAVERVWTKSDGEPRDSPRSARLARKARLFSREPLIVPSLTPITGGNSGREPTRRAARTCRASETSAEALAGTGNPRAPGVGGGRSGQRPNPVPAPGTGVALTETPPAFQIAQEVTPTSEVMRFPQQHGGRERR